MASAYLQRTQSGTETDSKKATISVWVKLGNHVGNFNAGIFGTHVSGNYGADGNSQIGFYNGGLYAWFLDNGGTAYYKQESTRRFRDHNAWYHIVYRFDMTESTASNRIRVYVNGEEVTSFASSNNPGSTQNIQMNNGGRIVRVGTYNFTGGGHNYLDGSMSDLHFCDGYSYAPTEFGETDATTGIWKPKTSPSVNYGTNGFFLKFDNSANMGLDSSGNSNNLTTNGTIIQNKDTPTNVFATLNVLDATSQTLSHVNLSGYGVTNKTSTATLGFSKGKYYWECKCVTQNTYTMIVGITNQTNMENGSYSSGNVGTNANGWSYFMQNNTDNGKAFNNNTLSSVYQTISQGDILQIAVDADAGKIWWGVNGTWVNSGDPANGTNAVYTNVSTDQMLFPAYSVYAGSGGTPLVSFNFGNGFFGTTAVSSAQNPDDGVGIFEYDPPAGYRALCTKSINAQEYS